MIEMIRPGANANRARVVLFDFDGTLSLIRSGWMDVMVPMMVEILAELKSGESEEQLRAVVEEFVWKLTGKETIYQMIAVADAVRERGGVPRAPLEYKKIYLDRLWLRIEGRVRELREGQVSPEKYLVPGAREFLELLVNRGLHLYLASGTDDASMQEEARLLQIDRYFAGGVYGALDDYRSFSKAILIERILATSEYTGEQFLGFGDGYVEIEEVKKVGGVTVGIASAEPECQTVDPWKRQRLIGAGADCIVPNFLCSVELADNLFPAS
jgi:phosphoglycolate phosphatase-like HAD superfamily hydrolase